MANEALLGRGLLDEFQTSTRALMDPAKIAEMGPERARAAYQMRKRQLPPSLQRFIGSDPDFAALDVPPEARVAELTKELASITNPDDPRLTAEGLRRRAPALRVDTERVTGGATTPGFGGFPLVTDVETEPTEAFTALQQLAEQQRTGLLAKEPTKSRTRIGPGGVQENVMFRDRDVPPGQELAEATERTTEQEGARQAGIFSAQTPAVVAREGATAQAREDVTNNPANQKARARGTGL
ncbi:MAG TPA: hypothetical protein VEI97_20160, partial [bacterium]|nr:hypothetical protein [bacterium]